MPVSTNKNREGQTILKDKSSSYDRLAEIYNEVWQQPYDEEIMQLLEKLMLGYLPERASILDLCCGTGNLIPPLLQKGYQVTGVDISEPMLRYARTKAPDSNFILSDARLLKLSPTFQGVVSIGSINHFLTLKDLKSVFENVFSALVENGNFGFNLAMETMYQSPEWINNVMASVRDDLVWVWQKNYNYNEKICTKKITILQLIENTWQRSDHTLLSKAYSQAEIQTALKDVGFRDINIYDLEKVLGQVEKRGNYVFVCRK